MKLDEINKSSLNPTNDKELLNLHYRCHQIYKQADASRNESLKDNLNDKHHMIVVEIKRRKLLHTSPLM